MIGRTLGGRYEVLGRLSEGGMALVYRGRRLEDGRAVAIKILRDQYAHNAEFVARFEREAQAVARLSHPHMVQIFDSGQDGDVHFIVMEFIEGEDLKTFLRRTGPLEEQRAREIGAQVCEVLDYAHSNGIIHRDIKPQNILVTSDGQVKVTDFGIARALASTTITETGTVLGSVQYLSPEQARGLGVGRSADLYSLGIVLYEAATGTLPFDGETPIAIALRHMHEPPPVPRRNGAPLSERMEGIILKALAKDARDRYRSAAEMREDLLGHAAHWRERPPAVDEDTAVIRRGAAGREDGRRRFRSPAALTPYTPFLAAGGALLVIFVGISVGWQAISAYLNVPEVTVPEFVGRTLTDAQVLARQDHLSVQVIQQTYSTTVPAGSVLAQDPPAGRTVKVNRVIGLTTSLGAEMVQVPDVRRHSLEDARFAIDQARLVVGEIRETYDQTVPSGYILLQDPAPGAAVARGEAVNLTVSKGQQTLILPDLVGRSLDEARRMLQDLGVTLRDVQQVPRADVAPGQVVAMAPPAGTRIQHGDAVSVTIAIRQGSSGGPPPQPIVTATPPVPTQTSPGQRQVRVRLVMPQGTLHQSVKIVVIDQQGVRVAYEGIHSPGENLDKQVAGMGYTIIQVYIEGRLIQEIRP
ncbi:MAG TPA: Stk1 family PASTA domain-containing Ser/Thr kinase [bacterium]|nr:Stk1 family PASTA domain-containing Ser/Thr kinase [bacterium]